MIVCETVTYRYRDTPAPALVDVDLTVPDGDRLGIVGVTGSGKSTLVQLFNGLLRATAGRVMVDGEDVADRRVARRLRRRVALVFQYPEQQFFAETVLADVAFGPRQLGVPAGRATAQAEQALAAVGLTNPDLWARSPFSLSSGERRRAAIAAALASDPQVIIVDEPTAGLDPVGRRQIVDLLGGLAAGGRTLVAVSHRLEDIVALCSSVAVLQAGRLVASGPIRQVLGDPRVVAAAGLDVPVPVRFLADLRQRGWPVRTDRLTVAEAVAELGPPPPASA